MDTFNIPWAMMAFYMAMIIVATQFVNEMLALFVPRIFKARDGEPEGTTTKRVTRLKRMLTVGTGFLVGLVYWKFSSMGKEVLFFGFFSSIVFYDWIFKALIRWFKDKTGVSRISKM